ncbi:MAG: glycosyltransferase family 4 protein [bacterium]|nr:glycosyltransferase family 4 protein [bacterium]
MPLKIAIDGRCLTDHYPGIGRYLFNLLRALPSAVSDAEISVFVDQEGVNTRFDFAVLEDLGIRLMPTRAAIRGLRQQLELPRELERLEASVFHAPYFISAYPSTCPTVVGIYDTIATRFPEGLPSMRARLGARLGTRLVVRSARAIITLSRYAKQDLAETLELPPERIVVTPAAAAPEFEPASDQEVAELRRRLRLPSRYALHVGTNKPHKNLDQLMKAWSEVRAFKESRCALLFAGAHDARHFSVEKAAERLGFDDVRCLGSVAEEDLPTLYTGAELFVLPSLYEGFGLPVLEAMACGTPVACSRTTGLPEAAGHAAGYFDPEDAESIATTLKRMLKNPVYSQALAERGRAHAQRLTWRRTARLTVDAYRRVAA